MSERYSRLFALPSPLYAVGAPVVITAGALLKDNQTGKVLAQLKIQNISDKAIKAAAVKLEPLDTIGEPLGEPVEFQYLDLNMARDMEFGQKTPIVLPDAAARGFRLSVSDVYFVDNSAWASSGAPWEPLPDPVTLEQAFGEKELAKQYRLEHGGDCKIMFHEEKDLWWCPCGAINHKSEPYCHKCRKEVAALAALNMGKLRASRDKRLEAERQQAEAERIAAAARAKRNKKIAMIAAPIAVVALIAGVLISNSLQKNSAYQDAVALMESGEYDAAVAAFEELGDYKDSAEQINNVRYKQALALVDEGNYDSAISIFTELGDYKDSTEQIEITQELQAEAERLTKYQTAIDLLDRHGEIWQYYQNVSESRKILEDLGNYRDCKVLLQNFYKEIIGIKYKANTVGESTLAYQYDNEGKMISDGYTTYIYNEDGTLASFITSTYDRYTVVSHDDDGRVLRAEDADDATTYTYTYDDNGRLASERFDSEYSSNETTYTYDDEGRLIRKTYSFFRDGYTRVTSYGYGYIDEDGTIISEGDNLYVMGWIYAPEKEK